MYLKIKLDKNLPHSISWHVIFLGNFFAKGLSSFGEVIGSVAELRCELVHSEDADIPQNLFDSRPLKSTNLCQPVDPQTDTPFASS